MENCDGQNHGQKKRKKNTKKNKKNKKTLKRNPEAKCMVCTWLKNLDYNDPNVIYPLYFPFFFH